MEIELSNGKKVEVKEVKFLDTLDAPRTDSPRMAAKFLIKLATNLTEEEVESLSLVDGAEVTKKMIEVNPGLETPKDFLSSKISDISGG